MLAAQLSFDIDVGLLQLIYPVTVVQSFNPSPVWMVSVGLNIVGRHLHIPDVFCRKPVVSGEYFNFLRHWRVGSGGDDS